MVTRFYCDKCGRDVTFNTEVCPYCGEVFDAVKCPVCKLIGKPKLFVNGCPSCGFTHPQQQFSQKSKQRITTVAKKKRRQPAITGDRRKWFQINIPPVWYKIAIVVFTLILFGMLYALYRMYA